MEIEIVCDNGQWLVDSRVLVARLGYDHTTIARSIKRHKDRLEAKSALRQFVQVLKHENYQGATRQVYWMLDERQCLILTGSLKKGTEADEWHDKLVDAFLAARNRVQELESRHAQLAPIHTLTDALRERALLNLKSVPEGYFSVMGELFKHLYNLEAILNRNLDDKATIEISVGLRWSRYARDVLHIPDADRRTYEHHYQNGRRDCNAWAYPIMYITTFDQWLWFMYIPNEFPSYVKYRAIYLKQCEVKQMAVPKKQQSQQIKAPQQLTLL